MNPQSTGSFGAASGGISPELQAAITGRQSNGGATSQVTQGAPTFNPQTQPASAPTAQAPSVGQSADASQPAPTAEQPFDQAEMKMLIGAVTNRMKAISKLQGV